MIHLNNDKLSLTYEELVGWVKKSSKG